MKYVVINWKAKKNFAEVKNWLQAFFENKPKLDNVQIILAPSTPFLAWVKQYIEDKNIDDIKIASQDVSKFDKGSYTGEATAYSLQNIVEYAIIGHSERRKYLNEDISTLTQKVSLSLKYNIQPIFCTSKIEEEIPNGVRMIAYEPLDSIGTGNNLAVEKVIEFKNRKLKNNSRIIFLYGGSVNHNNIYEYLMQSDIDGVLIGTASLEVDNFLKILKKLKKRI